MKPWSFQENSRAKFSHYVIRSDRERVIFRKVDRRRARFMP